MKIKSKHKILKEKDTNKDKKILTSKSRFRGTFSEVVVRQQLGLDGKLTAFAVNRQT